MRGLVTNPPATAEEWARLVEEEADRLECDPPTIAEQIATAQERYDDEDTLAIRIISDGTIRGTVVVDDETGRPLRGVSRVAMRLGFAHGHRAFASCVLTIADVKIETDGILASVERE